MLWLILLLIPVIVPVFPVSVLLSEYMYKYIPVLLLLVAVLFINILLEHVESLMPILSAARTDHGIPGRDTFGRS